MKKLLSLALLAAMLIFSSKAMAQSWGPDFAKFNITPEAGWTASAVDSGVQLTNNKSVMIVQVVKSGGMKPEDFAKAVVAKAGITDPKYTSSDEGCKMVGKKEGQEITMVLVADDDKMAIFTLSGPDSEAMGKMMESLQDAN